MKKSLFMVIAVMVLGLICTSDNKIARIDAQPIVYSSYKSPEGSKDELYQDIFITLLMPCIDTAIGNFYSEYLRDLPGVAPWSVKVVNIDRPNGDRTSMFIIKLEILPYIGPHNSVGRDQLTIRVQYGRGPKVEDFVHLKSYPIAPNYQHIIKKWPPE